MIMLDMEELENNQEYQKLLQRYNELKEKIDNLENDRTLFEHEIILDSGTTIYPSLTSAYFRYNGEKQVINKQLSDIRASIKNK
jgi:predicted nuclease with TOPRIM domain